MIIGVSAVGVLLVVCGVVGMACGERVITEKGGFIIRLLRWPPSWAKYLKWSVGLTLISVGAILLMVAVTYSQNTAT